MSHIAQYCSRLGAVNQELFLEAMRCVACQEQAQNGAFGTTVHSYDEGRNVRSWQGQRIAGSITTTDLPQGIGVYFDGHGKPVFIADALWEAETVTGLNRNDRRFAPLEKRSAAAIERLQRSIELAYRSLAVQLVLKAHGFSLEVLPSQQASGGLVIQAQKAGS